MRDADLAFIPPGPAETRKVRGRPRTDPEQRQRERSQCRDIHRFETPQGGLERRPGPAHPELVFGAGTLIRHPELPFRRRSLEQTTDFVESTSRRRIAERDQQGDETGEAVPVEVWLHVLSRERRGRELVGLVPSPELGQDLDAVMCQVAAV